MGKWTLNSIQSDRPTYHHKELDKWIIIGRYHDIRSWLLKHFKIREIHYPNKGSLNFYLCRPWHDLCDAFIVEVVTTAYQLRGKRDFYEVIDLYDLCEDIREEEYKIRQLAHSRRNVRDLLTTYQFPDPGLDHRRASGTPLFSRARDLEPEQETPEWLLKRSSSAPSVDQKK